MIDVSKAFERVNFWLLFQKLLYRNVPLFIVRILAMWYTHQKMCIIWGNAISPSFTVVSFRWYFSPSFRWYYIANSFQRLYGWVKVLEKCTKNLIGQSRLAFNNHESNIDC